jgi:isoaspartyl peptidase/L-asparaginase-like protein (Ntn-hydrolase superfamily)
MTLFLGSWREPGRAAVTEAWSRHVSGGSVCDCLEAGLAACELDPSFMAIGRGSLPNSDGELELDAAMMVGEDLSAGAVCALRGIVPAISVARRVLERTPHVLLAGDAARRFALSQGFEPQNLMTAENIRRYETWRDRPEERSEEYLHSVNARVPVDHHGDTVTMIGVVDGKTVSASSTSGIAWKQPGRVGDSPIIGAGLYADDEVGAAGATGWGEELWKASASFRTVDRMRAGLSAQEACEDTIRQMLIRQPNTQRLACVVFASDRHGDYGAACTKGEFPLWICRDGDLSMQVYPAMSLDG